MADPPIDFLKHTSNAEVSESSKTPILNPRSTKLSPKLQEMTSQTFLAPTQLSTPHVHRIFSNYITKQRQIQ